MKSKAECSPVTVEADQFVVFTYDDGLPNRCLSVKGKDGYTKYWAREVTMPTEKAVELYNQLRHALFD
jgi:hypothetical protein